MHQLLLFSAKSSSKSTQVNPPEKLDNLLYVGSLLPAHILLVDRFIMTHLICSQRWLYIWQIMHAVPSDKPSSTHAKWGIFSCIQTRNCTFVLFLSLSFLASMWHPSRVEAEMPFLSSNPHLLPLYMPLLPISVTEADTGGGPDGVCYTCFAVVRLLFIRHRGGGSGSSNGPPRRKLLFRSLKRSEKGAGDKNKCPY